MAERLTLIGIASMFILIWTLVIVQIFTNDQLEPSQAIVVEEEESLGDNLPPGATYLEYEKTEDIKRPNDIEYSEEINLMEYDFSDIATKDGIPIEGILGKLDLK